MPAITRHLAPALAALALACANDVPSETPSLMGSGVDVVPGVVIGDGSAKYATSDAYQIVRQPNVVGDTLHVTVQYGGGCTRHVFTLLASQVFMESHPVQSAIAIHHNSNEDRCDALITQELNFDLTRLREAWRRSYQQQSGTIILRLRGYDGRIVYEF